MVSQNLSLEAAFNSANLRLDTMASMLHAGADEGGGVGRRKHYQLPL